MSSFFRSSKNKPAFTSAKKDSSPKKLFLKLASSDHPEPVNYSERGIHPESHGGLHANPSRFASDYVAPHARKLEERSKSVSHLEKSDKGKDLGTSSKPISRGKDRERTQSLNTPAKEIPLAKSTSKNGSKDSNRKERLVDPLVKETQTSSLFQRRRTVSTGGPAGRDPTPSDENRSFSDLRRSPKKKYSPSGRKLELVEEEDKVREWLHRSTSLPQANPSHSSRRSKEKEPQTFPSRTLQPSMSLGGASVHLQASIKSPSTELSHQSSTFESVNTSSSSQQASIALNSQRPNLRSYLSDPSNLSSASFNSSVNSADPTALLNALEDLATTVERSRAKRLEKEKEEKLKEKIKKEMKREIKREVSKRLEVEPSRMVPSPTSTERISTGVNTETEMSSYFVPSHYEQPSSSFTIQTGRRSSSTNTTLPSLRRNDSGLSRESEVTQASSFLSFSESESNSEVEGEKNKNLFASGIVRAASSSPKPSAATSTSNRPFKSKGSSPTSVHSSLISSSGVLLPLAANPSPPTVTTDNSSEDSVRTMFAAKKLKQKRSTSEAPSISRERRDQLLAQLYGLAKSELTTSSPSSSDLGTVLFQHGSHFPSPVLRDEIDLSTSTRNQENELGLSFNNHGSFTTFKEVISPSPSSELSWGSLGPPSDLGVALALEEQAAMRREELLKKSFSSDSREPVSREDIRRSQFIEEQHRLLKLHEQEREKQRKGLELLFGSTSDVDWGSLGTPTEFESAKSDTTLSHPSGNIDYEKTPTTKCVPLADSSSSTSSRNDYELHVNALLRLAKSDPSIKELLRVKFSQGVDLNQHSALELPRTSSDSGSSGFLFENPSSKQCIGGNDSDLSSSRFQGNAEEIQYLQAMRNRSKERVEGWRGEILFKDERVHDRKAFAEV